MRRRQIFAQKAKEAAQALREFVVGPGIITDDSVPEIDVSYKCDCGKTFTTDHGLKIHKARAHGNAQ